IILIMRITRTISFRRRLFQDRVNTLHSKRPIKRWRESRAVSFPPASHHGNPQEWFSFPTKEEQRKRQTVFTPALRQLYAQFNSALMKETDEVSVTVMGIGWDYDGTHRGGSRQTLCGCLLCQAYHRHPQNYGTN